MEKESSHHATKQKLVARKNFKQTLKELRHKSLIRLYTELKAELGRRTSPRSNHVDEIRAHNKQLKEENRKLINKLNTLKDKYINLLEQNQK